MSQQLARLHAALGRYASSFDPAVVTATRRGAHPRRSEHDQDDGGGIEAKAAPLADTSVWKKSGERSPAHELATKTGTSVAQARAAIQTGRLLQELPATNDALSRGEISIEQASLVAGAASADPDAEARLLDATRSESIGELRDTCARVKANSTDMEARRRRIHEQRSLRSWTDGSGTGHLHLQDNPEKVAEIMAGLAPTRDHLFKKARKEGRRERPEAYGADALHQVVCRPRSAAKPTGTTKLLVRVDLEKLVGRATSGDEICEIAGYGPIAVSAVHEMLDDRRPVPRRHRDQGQGSGRRRPPRP